MKNFRQNPNGQAIVELTVILSLVLVMVFMGLKISGIIQKSFNHQFVEKTKDYSEDFTIPRFEGLVFFKNSKERKEFKEKYDPKKVLIIKDLGIIL